MFSSEPPVNAVTALMHVNLGGRIFSLSKICQPSSGKHVLVAKTSHGFMHDQSLVEWLQSALHLHSDSGSILGASEWAENLEREQDESAESKDADEVPASVRLQLARTLARDDVHSVTVHVYGSHFHDGPWSLPSTRTVLSLHPVFVTHIDKSFEPFPVADEPDVAADADEISGENLFASVEFDAFRSAGAPRASQWLRLSQLDQVASAGQLVMDAALRVNQQHRQQSGTALDYEHGSFQSVVHISDSNDDDSAIMKDVILDHLTVVQGAYLFWLDESGRIVGQIEKILPADVWFFISSGI